jgi:hypothetical protein
VRRPSRVVGILSLPSVHECHHLGETSWQRTEWVLWIVIMIQPGLRDDLGRTVEAAWWRSS